MKDSITTGLGTFSREKFDALIRIRETALDGLRQSLKYLGYTEVTTSSLVNIAGSCENPYASFTLNYYGREAHLSQSAQLQLEALVIRLKRGFFTVNNSFREENYNDPDASGRRLTEFTLIEAEAPYEPLTTECALDRIIKQQETLVKATTEKVLETCWKQIQQLGGDSSYLTKIVDSKFQRISYTDALGLLNENGRQYNFGDDMGIREERTILEHFNQRPTFVTNHPASIKFFNMKRDATETCVYSADLLTPRLGETIGGALREEDGGKIKKCLRESNIGRYLSERGQNPEREFEEYLDLFEHEGQFLRGGYGIGFERFVAFLINSNDILDTITYRTLHPS